MTLADGSDCWSMTVQRSDSIDEQEVRRSLGLLVDSAHHVQIQALPSGRWKQISGRDTDGLIKAIQEYSDEKGVYLSLNPFSGNLDRPLRSSDIASRRWFLVDPDAVKPGDKDASTTDDEKEQSRAVTESVRDHLRTLGWPDPIFVDSGNNWQLLYRVDLPNDRLSQQILSKALKALADQFDTDGVKIDRAVHDAKRICKIPGTMVRKGGNAATRPWRMARLISVPVMLSPVPIALLKGLAGLGENEPAKVASVTPINPWSIPVGGDDRTAYARSAFEREIGIVATASQPGRNGVLYNASLKLGTLVAAGLLDRTDVERQLEAAARACGLGQDGDPNEIDRAIKHGFTFGLQNPRQIPEKFATKQSAESAAYVALAAAEETVEPLFIKASSVTPKKVVWFWENRIPMGFITVFAGRTGLGKSFVTCDIVARKTAGEPWPDSTDPGECSEPGNVLLISEDPFEYVLTPRLIEMGANLDRVFYLSWSAMARYQLGDTTFLDAAFEQMAPLSLVAIDPPTNFLGGKDEHKNAEVRAMLMNLVIWLNGRDTACILITHVNKASGKGGEALSRVIGSVAWTTTSRVAHAFVADADRPDGAIFVPMKSNLGALPKGIAYRIAKTENFAKVEWLGQVDATADEAFGGEKPKEDKQTKTAAAVEWLRERFAERGTWASDEIISLGETAGFNRDQMFAAKKALGSKAEKGRGPGAEWYWKLDENAKDSSTVTTLSTVTDFGDQPY
jgi:hypothetical protein